MANLNSSNSTATSFTWGMLQVLRTTVTSVMAITAVLVSAGILFGLTGCSEDKSKKDNKVNSSQSNQPQTGAVQPQTSLRVPTVAKNKKSKTPGKRPATLTYMSSTYGISFRFPGQFELTTPGNIEESSLAEPVPNNFVQPGGVTVATIELPSGSATSFFNVSANRSLTAQECREFATPAPSDLFVNVPVDESDGSIPVKTSIHGLEFTKVENASEQEDVKYYHHFAPAPDGVGGTCYEFAMGVEQARVSSKTLDYSELFDKLERIMATVQIQGHEGATVAATVPGHDGKSY